jgi:hypothetical protein
VPERNRTVNERDDGRASFEDFVSMDHELPDVEDHEVVEPQAEEARLPPEQKMLTTSWLVPRPRTDLAEETLQ